MGINYNWRKVTRINYFSKKYTHKLFIENYIHKFVLGTDFMYVYRIVGDSSRIMMLGLGRETSKMPSACGWTWPAEREWCVSS
jgi:hypothetical protein